MDVLGLIVILLMVFGFFLSRMKSMVFFIEDVCERLVVIDEVMEEDLLE